MEIDLASFKLRTFHGGIHPPESKLTAAKHIEKCPLPPVVIIPIQQHIGAPSEPVVEKGQSVKAGDPVSRSKGFVSVPSHASISGTVKSIENRPHPLGPNVLSVIIESDGQDAWNPDIRFQDNYLDLPVDEIRNRVKE